MLHTASSQSGLSVPKISCFRQRQLRKSTAVRRAICQAPDSTGQAEQQQQAGRPAPRLIGPTRRALLLGSTAGALCACCPPLPTPANAAEWGYTCPGPAAWEGTCKDSVSQSPINIPLPNKVAREQLNVATARPIAFRYPGTLSKCTVLNTGHGTPQVKPPADGLVGFSMGEDTFELLQYHFHAPSEHTFDGDTAAMEAHLVHKNTRTGDLCVLAILLERGAEVPNPCLDAALGGCRPDDPAGKEMPLSRGIDLMALLPKPRDTDGRRPYVTYSGSLTTPPCSENVTFTVFLDPLRVNDQQIVDFLMFAGGGSTLGVNARPVQPLGSRKLSFFI